MCYMISGGFLLNRDEILKQKAMGNVFIEPFDPGNLQAVGYDVRIGPYFYRAKDPGDGINIFNPLDPNTRHWGKVQKAISATDWMAKNDHKLKNISAMDHIIIVRPGELILGHTVEFIGGINCIATEMRTRSSLGRIGGATCKCAGRGDPGFINRWTMEFSNSTNAPLFIPVGLRVAQILFYLINPVKGYVGKGGKYQSTEDTEIMIKEWKPKDMLPKLYLDPDIGRFDQCWSW